MREIAAVAAADILQMPPTIFADPKTVYGLGRIS
jgi:hypothetical protein